MDTNYFVCTLGQAALIEDRPVYPTLNAFLEHQSQTIPDAPAVGFFDPQEKHEGRLSTRILTFGELHKAVQTVSAKLHKHLEHEIKAGEPIALLCPSTAQFMLTWLALIRLGASVLLLAPQLHASAIAHLCKTCNASTLIHEEMYEKLATDAVTAASDDTAHIGLLEVSSFCTSDVFSLLEDKADQVESPKLEPSTIAYIFHTSGTSSGLPKPIPQSHRAAVGVLPHLVQDVTKATFTTTPLYHGGISDCLRAWTSDSLIWLFAGKHIPITAANVIRCLESIPSEHQGKALPEARYFTSVPYILQMMGDSERGLKVLKEMDLVGVGGAALPAQIGDHLVAEGVKLVSRYGSAECGFLLSSHRDYGKDNDWQFLRTDTGMEHIDLEPQGSGLSEVVVRPGWPHMAKTNREDGSYATSDLLEPHSQIPNAWRYHSRADAQLTLITGKKFDPSPLEGALTSSDLIMDALIFGNNQPYPGVLIFPSVVTSERPKNEARDNILSLVEKINAESQSHARVPASMVVIMPHTDAPLEKSSKGTILRNKAEDRYASAIDRAYAQSESADTQNIGDKDVVSFVINSVNQVKQSSVALDVDTDLYAYGLDSVASIQIRRKLQSLLPEKAGSLPMSVIEDCGTPRKLAEHIVNIRQGKSNENDESDLDLMLKLSKEYGDFKETHISRAQIHDALPSKSKHIVLLTGATGALGAHILDQCRRSTHVRAIFCLVRGQDKHAARERVEKSLVSKGLEGLDADLGNSCNVVVLPARLGEPDLGLDKETYDKLAADVTVVVHLAWEVNFRLRLRNFVKDSITGLHNLLQLALNSHCQEAPLFLYCSSTSSVISSTQNPIKEEISEDPTAASPLGYSRSKWVAEQLCVATNTFGRLRGKVSILRVGQLAGDSQRGIWNAKEAWPMMLSTVKISGTLPRLKDESLGWLPVDLAATAFLQVMASQSESNGDNEGATKVYHVLNPHKEPSWTQMLEWLQKEQEFDIVEPAVWVNRLEQLQEEHAEHPAMKLLGLWQNAYADSAVANGQKKTPSFSMEDTIKVAPIMRDIKPLDEEYCRKVWSWVQQQF